MTNDKGPIKVHACMWQHWRCGTARTINAVCEAASEEIEGGALAMRGSERANDSQHYNKSVNIMAKDTLVIG